MVISRKVSGNERWQEILETAAQLFRVKGYHGVSLDEIASTLKLNKASLYYYIKSKEELLHECHKAAFIPLMEEMRSIVQTQEEPVIKFEKMIDVHLKRLLDELKIAPFFLQHLEALPVNVREQIVLDRNEYDSLFRIVLEEGMAKGTFIRQNVTVTTYLILGALNWVPYWYKEGGAMSKEEITSFMRNNILRMMGVKEPESK